MRKFLITLTVVALILSIVGTGIIVYIDSANAPENPTLEPSDTTTGE